MGSEEFLFKYNTITRHLVLKKIFQFIPSFLLIGFCFGFVGGTPLFSDDVPMDDRANWRVLWANDAPFDSDNQFSNGFGLGLNSPLAGSLEETKGTPAFGKGLAGWFLPEREELYYRESWSLGHHMQHPDDLRESELILDDVPYVSLLAWSNSYIAFNNEEFTGFQTLIGWTGHYTFGEELQRNGHKFFDANQPAGWENQLENELILNLYYMRKWKAVEGPWADLSFNLDAALGNMFTFAQTAMEFRLGDRPGGFAYQVNSIGHALDYDARIYSGEKSYLYATLILRGRALIHALSRDGNYIRSDNPWTEHNELDERIFIGQAGISLHYERRDWGIQGSLYFSSNSVDNTGRDTQVADPQNNFVVIMFEKFF